MLLPVFLVVTAALVGYSSKDAPQYLQTTVLPSFLFLQTGQNFPKLSKLPFSKIQGIA